MSERLPNAFTMLLAVLKPKRAADWPFFLLVSVPVCGLVVLIDSVARVVCFFASRPVLSTLFQRAGRRSRCSEAR